MLITNDMEPAVGDVFVLWSVGRSVGWIKENGERECDGDQPKPVVFSGDLV